MRTMEHTLAVYADAHLIFHSDGSWLHPLFALERFLRTSSHDPANLVVWDKVVGRAAALLHVYLGVGRVRAHLMSELGRQALIHHGVPHICEVLVPRIDCQTESLLAEELDPQVAYRLLRRRAS